MDALEKNRVSSSKSPFGLYKIPIIVGCLGILISSAAFIVERAGETERIKMRLEEDGSERFISIKSEFDHLKDSVTSIQALFDASDNVTRGEFGVFVQYTLKAHRDIQALEWIPRVQDEKRQELEDAAIRDGLEGFRFTERQTKGIMVRAAKRDEYFPVYYVEPLKGNEAAMGFDLASNKARLQSLNTSRDTGKLTATAKITLVQEATTQPGFLMFQPIYKKGAPANTVTERRAALEGFALGVYRIGDLLDYALEEFLPAGIDFTVFDISAPQGEEFLYHYDDKRADEEPHEQINDIASLVKGLSHSEIMDVGGRKWRIIFTPTSEFMISNKTNISYYFLAFGLIITGALVAMSSLLINRTRKVTMLVDVRTEELRRAQDELEIRVDERTKALSDAEQAREKIDGILKSVADGLIVTDMDNIIVLMNKAAETLFEVTQSKASGKTIDDIVHDKALRERIKKTFGKKEAGMPFDFDWQSGDSKEPRVMNARTSVIYDREGVETGIVTIIHDVTEERAVDRMKTEFLSTAAHELRTPLTSIQGFSEILITKDDLSEDERGKFLRYINEQSVDLANIVSDLLDIAKIEAGHSFELNKVACNAGETIRKIIPHFRESYGNYTFEATLPHDDAEISVDKDKVAQVLKNIVSNAVKYSTPHDIIRVIGKVVGNSYHIIVEDHGIGMTQEQVSKIFDKFYRVDASDSAPEGTGLGMTIAKHIVEAHDGTITVESEPGKGTKVTISLPR